MHIHQKFSEIAAIHLDRTALRFKDESISYRQLETMSNQLAQHLIRADILPGERVAILSEKGFEQIISALAILKVGATYIPIDIDYPKERIAHILSDSQPKCVLVLSSDTSICEPFLVLNIHTLLQNENYKDNIYINPNSSKSAYIIYTSGSTGRPKGVEVPHENVIALLSATQDLMELSSQDVWTMFHSFAFDFSVWEIWGSLLTGATLVIVDKSTSRDPDAFCELIKKEGVTILNQTPSAFRLFSDAEKSTLSGESIRLVIFGGEKLHPRTLLSWMDRYPTSQCRLINMYGITETTVHVTHKTITRRDALTNSASVGRPLAGWSVMIVDEAGNEVLNGVKGEILVSGAGVASGYVNNPSLTAERFIHRDPLDVRFYKSGDLGLIRPDGELEHHGRIDNQIKLRGFRIELDEIQHALLALSGVNWSLTHFEQDIEGGDRIISYVVGKELTSSDIRQALKLALPEFMIPSDIRLLERIPLTSNGKTDLSALQEEFSDRQSSADITSDPLSLNRTEHALIRIWRKTIGVAVDSESNFFDIGGNSLLAVRLTKLMQSEISPRISLQDLYRLQTPRRIHEYLGSED